MRLADKSDDDGNDDIVRHSTPKHPDEKESSSDGGHVVGGPPLLRAGVGCPDDVTIPDDQYNLMSTTETGDTIQSSAFLNLDRGAREGSEKEVTPIGRDESGPTHEERGAVSTEVEEDFNLLNLEEDFFWGKLDFQRKPSELFENSIGNEDGKVDAISTDSLHSQITHEGRGAVLTEVEDDQDRHVEGNTSSEERENAGWGVDDDFKKGEKAMSQKLAPGRYPRRTVTQRTRVEEKEEGDQGVKDIYDFEDDSFDDKDFVPPQRDLLKVYSPSKPVVEINCSRNRVGPPKEAAPMRTPPEVFKGRRDPEVEQRWRQAGGHTPDQSEDKSKRYGSFDPDLLRMLVHMLAKSRKIDLSKEPLKPGFFKELVRLYGDVPNTNSAKLAPYRSHEYIQKKWRQLFCTKKVSKSGLVQADVHKFEHPQENGIPCQLCNEQPDDQTPDLRDHMLQRLADQVSGRERREMTETSAPSVEQQKAKGQKEPCPDCHRDVADLKRHLKENCRANPNNLLECPQCKMMILKRSLPEHLYGRLDKTGTVINQPCKGNNEGGKSKKVRCTICGILVKDLRRHTKERHEKKGQPVQSSKSVGGKRPAESAAGDTIRDAKKKKQGESPLPQEPKQTIQMSPADILRTFEDWIYKYQQRKSMEEVSGINQEEMIMEAIRFMENALGITMSRAPFTIDLDGDCLYNCLAFIANPHLSKEENSQMGTTLRWTVMEEAIEMIRTMPGDRLQPILLAAAGDDSGELLTREELLAMLERYRENGQWEGALGDLIPQLCASFTRTPLFVIWIDLDNNQTTGYFVNPAHVFDQPEYESVPRVVVRMNDHYEPLLLPGEANEALKAIYRHAQTSHLQMAAIRLPVTCKDGGGVMEKRRDRTPSPGSSNRRSKKSGGNTAGMPQQGRHEQGQGCQGNHNQDVGTLIVT